MTIGRTLVEAYRWYKVCTVVDWLGTQTGEERGKFDKIDDWSSAETIG